MASFPLTDAHVSRRSTGTAVAARRMRTDLQDALAGATIPEERATPAPDCSDSADPVCERASAETTHTAEDAAPCARDSRGSAASASGGSIPAATLAEEQAAHPTGSMAPGSEPMSDAEADELEDLADQITTLAAHIHAANHQLLTLIAEFDQRRGWEVGGFPSCAHWLAFHTGMDMGTAREKVRTARALEDLPQISAAMSLGELSFSKVRSLTRVCTPANESELLAFARTNTTANLERLVRGWRRNNRLDEVELERVRHRSRTFSVFPDEDGMYVVRGRVDPEVGAVLMRAVEAASDALFRPELAEEIEPQQRRADALGLVAERALAAGFGNGARGGAREVDEGGDAEADEGGDAEALEEAERAAAIEGAEVAGSARSGGDGAQELTGEDGAQGAGRRDGPQGAVDGDGVRGVPVSGSRAERYQVVLHVERPTLQSFAEPGRSELEDGTRGRVARAVARPSPLRSEQGDFHHSAPPPSRLREP